MNKDNGASLRRFRRLLRRFSRDCRPAEKSKGHWKSHRLQGENFRQGLADVG